LKKKNNNSLTVMMKSNYTNYLAYRVALENGDTTAVNEVNSFLAEIESQKHLNAFLETFDDTALALAAQVDEKIKNGTAGKLAGMVIGLKDNLCYKDHSVSVSSKILSNFKSLFSATAVARLLAEDAIIIGRLNCDEFAMGSSNEKSAFGPVLNPYDNTRVSGGSSGGSAVAVAANLCHASLGTDTGGSVRQPASFTGTVGLKPTYGRISRWGLIAYGSSLDQIGPFTKTVQDSALLLEVMAGGDEFDTTASPLPVADYSQANSEGKKKIAVLRDALESEGLSLAVKKRFTEVIEKLKADGHQVDVVDFSLLNQMVPTYYVISNAEASSNLSRFDGIHYGYRSPAATDIESTYVKSRTEGFGEEVKRRIMMGTFVLSTGYYDAYFAKAQKVRRLIQDKTKAIFENYDLVLTPTTPHGAFKLGHNSTDPIAMYLEDIFTVHANLAGNPAISLPMGTNEEGMPFGIQLMAPFFGEKEMFGFADRLMKL
jgi:aspartyl-tRNA(Asn)/glutamyl-tRNA(Gln) amidotransferase subunit A